MRVTQKGQVTIPLHVRRELGITSGTEVRFVLEGDHARLERVVDPGAVAERMERYAGTANTDLTTDEILALTRR